MALRPLAALAALTLLVSCAFPTYSPWKLKAIEAESRILMAKPTGANGAVPESRWPATIASLEPEFVMVGPDGVDILIKPYFDGGWGYFVPRDAKKFVAFPCRYSALGHGVYWFHPC